MRGAWRASLASSSAPSGATPATSSYAAHASSGWSARASSRAPREHVGRPLIGRDPGEQRRLSVRPLAPDSSTSPRRAASDASDFGAVAIARSNDAYRRSVFAEPALRVAEPPPELGALRIAGAAITGRIPRRERTPQPRGGALVVARGQHDAARARDRLGVERMRGDQALGRSRARAEVAAGRERFRRFLVELLRGVGLGEREARAGLGALDVAPRTRCSASSFASTEALPASATCAQQRSARHGR